jgi:glutathione S-transferase kappa 1
MNASHNTPPAGVPAKAAYMTQDVARLAKHFNVPLKSPKDFGSRIAAGTLGAMRVITAVSLAKPDKVEAVSRAFWMRIWSRDQDIATEESFRAVLSEVGIKITADQDKILAATKSQAVKDELKRNTEAAVKAGAFGAPTMLVHMNGKQEMFWGSDRLELIAFLNKWQWLGPDPQQKNSTCPNSNNNSAAKLKSKL